MTPSDPLPCPWCGTVPEVWSGILTDRYHVSCDNEYCRAQPDITAHTREEAIRRWNDRKE